MQVRFFFGCFIEIDFDIIFKLMSKLSKKKKKQGNFFTSSNEITPLMKLAQLSQCKTKNYIELADKYPYIYACIAHIYPCISAGLMIS